MRDLKAAQMHERPFRPAKDHVQPLAALDSFLPYGKKGSCAAEDCMDTLATLKGRSCICVALRLHISYK